MQVLVEVQLQKVAELNNPPPSSSYQIALSEMPNTIRFLCCKEKYYKTTSFTKYRYFTTLAIPTISSIYKLPNL